MRRLRLQVSNVPNLRGQGAIVGFLVACAFVAAGLLSMLGEEGGTTVFLTQGIPTLIAGLLGGWLLAPRAARAASRRDWLGVVLLLGVVAVVLGAIGVGIAMGVESTLRSGAGPGQLMLSIVVGGLMLAPLGVLVFGWMILPLTTLAAGIWALVMARLLRRAPARAR